MKNFKLFDYSRPGKGVKKGADKRFTFLNFFPLYKRKFWSLIGLNLLWLACNFPLLVGFFELSGKADIPFSTPADPLYAILNGVSLYGSNPALCALWGVSGINITATADSTLSVILKCIAALALITFGPANTGMAYILRGYSKEEYTEMPADFFKTIKKNFLQSVLLGLADAFILFALYFDILFFYQNASDSLYSAFFVISLFLAFIYFVMRFYLYPLLVTFSLSVGKIIKNAFLFAVLGFKRNIVGTLGIALVLFLNYMIAALYFPLGALLPFFITISTASFIGVYAAWPSVKRFMIDPYYHTDDTPEEAPDTEEPIFRDNG